MTRPAEDSECALQTAAELRIQHQGSTRNITAQPGTWVHMPAGLRHSIQAKKAVVMLLLLLK
jgi:hypothetical protein